MLIKITQNHLSKNKFSKNNQPKSDKNCGLGVHTASNQHNERKFEYYWGYKNHILVDCITGLPIYELTTTADVADSTVTLDILSQTNSFLSVDECTFLADKGYDVKAVYNTVKELYHGECIIPLNKRNAKNPKKLASGHPVCEAGLAMHKDGKFTDNGRTRQKYCCPFKRSKSGVCPCNHKNWYNGRKCRGCTNMLLFPMIIVFLSTVNVSLSKSFMRSEPKPNVTIRVLSRQGKSAFGFTASMPHKT